MLSSAVASLSVSQSLTVNQIQTEYQLWPLQVKLFKVAINAISLQ